MAKHHPAHVGQGGSSAQIPVIANTAAAGPKGARSDDRYPHSIGLGEPPSMTSTASGSESGLKVAV
jgi:hypothetical protein